MGTPHLSLEVPASSSSSSRISLSLPITLSEACPVVVPSHTIRVTRTLEIQGQVQVERAIEVVVETSVPLSFALSRGGHSRYHWFHDQDQDPDPDQDSVSILVPFGSRTIKHHSQ
jgi:hypothetical protein